MVVIDKNKIYNEDCMDTMERMEENAVNLLLTDPPYGIGYAKEAHNNSNSCVKTEKWDGKKTEYLNKEWDKKIGKKYFDEIFRVSKEQIIFGGNYYTEYLRESSCWFFWDKRNNGNFGDGELAWTSFDKTIKKYEWLWDGFRKENYNDEGRERIHPTQKPTGLMKNILQDWAEDDWTIYDPFAGSGPIPLACEQLGYEWIASEKDEDYVSKARKRIKRERDQLKAF